MEWPTILRRSLTRRHPLTWLAHRVSGGYLRSFKTKHGRIDVPQAVPNLSRGSHHTCVHCVGAAVQQGIDIALHSERNVYCALPLASFYLLQIVFCSLASVFFRFVAFQISLFAYSICPFLGGSSVLLQRGNKENAMTWSGLPSSNRKG